MYKSDGTHANSHAVPSINAIQPRVSSNIPSPQVPIARRKPMRWDPVRHAGIPNYKLTC